MCSVMFFFFFKKNFLYLHLMTGPQGGTIKTYESGYVLLIIPPFLLLNELLSRDRITGLFRRRKKIPAEQL